LAALEAQAAAEAKAAAAAVAKDLILDGVATRPFIARGPGAGEIARLIVDDINAGAAVVTLTVAANSCRKLAERLWARIRQADDVIAITIDLPGRAEPRVLRVRRDDADGVDKILDFVIDVFPAGLGESKGSS
jgi:hypothetical protein